MDYENMKKEEVSDSDLHRVATLAHRQVNIQEDIKKRETELKNLQEKLLQVAEVDLPELMKEIGLMTFTLTSGEVIKIDHQIFASITGKNESAAFGWLEKNNFDGIVKGEVKIALNKGEMEKMLEALKLLQENGFNATSKKSVHWQTLRAFVKERIEDGSEFPRETFGVFEKDVAIIK